MLCDSKPPSKESLAQKLPGQPRSLTAPVLSTVSGSSARRGCKPASHYEPSMIVHPPSSESVSASPFITPPLRRQKPTAPPAGSRVPSATLRQASDQWSTSLYRPADSDFVAYRAAVAYEGDVTDVTPGGSRQGPPNETSGLRHRIGDVQSPAVLTSIPFSWSSETKDATTEVGSFIEIIKAEPAMASESSKPVKTDRSVSSHDHQMPASVAQRPSDSVRVAGVTASQLSQVCRQTQSCLLYTSPSPRDS